MMTFGDMDWGDAQWDVDSKAESLNKSLFGSRKFNIHQVKADLNLSDKNETGFAIDSDDDDEKLSKKAKKKLKERRRMENRKKKNDSASADGDAEKHEDEGGKNKEIVNIKTIVPKSNTLVKKKKEKNGDTKSASTSKLDDTIEPVGKSEASVGKSQDKDGVKKKKRKNPTSVAEEGEETHVKLKKKKTDDIDSNVNGEDEPKKRKRKKKKKPNSKKNKYKHLGLKSKSSNQNIAESDSEDETVKGNRKDIVASKKNSVTIDGLKSTKGNKRKNSLSGEEQMPSKKTKVSDESEKPSVEIKAKKKKKAQNSGETSVSVIEEKEENKVNEKQKEKKSKEVKKGKTATPGDENGKLKIEKEVSKKLKTEKKKKKKKDSIIDANKADAQNSLKQPAETSKSSPFFSSSQGSELQQKMVEKLMSARFRFINEQLYTIKGGDALRMFQQDKTLMEAYNTGFQGQVKQWSVNPLDVIIKQLNTKPAQLTVVDFGCGEARLSASVPQKVHSFDLFPLNERVTVCDMSKTPLTSDSIDVAVFCLSLMGTNLNDYILEANRILKEGGLLKIAEVVSRFTNSNHFINAVSSMGFRAVNTRELSTMFYLMDFKKVKKVEKMSKQAKAISLKPCLYKKR